MYRPYKLNVYINGIMFQEIIIDNHVTEKHGESIDDFLVLKLVGLLGGKEFDPIKVDANGFQYFVRDNLMYLDRPYKLVWLLPPDNSYIGVRTAFRKNYGK